MNISFRGHEFVCENIVLMQKLYTYTYYNTICFSTP